MACFAAIHELTIFGEIVLFTKTRYLRMNVMKNLIIPFAFIMFFLSAGAQKFNGGIHAGLAGSQVAGDTYAGFDKAGISAAGFVNLEVKPGWYLQMEIGYLQKGSRHTPNNEKEQYDDYKLNLDYIEIPLLVKYKLNEKLMFESGLSASYLVNYKESLNGLELDRNSLNDLCASFIAGIYFQFMENMQANFRTNNNITAISSNNQGVKRFFSKYGQFNDVIVLSVHYTF